MVWNPLLIHSPCYYRIILHDLTAFDVVNEYERRQPLFRVVYIPKGLYV